jgi:hypothetical protein
MASTAKARTGRSTYFGAQIYIDCGTLPVPMRLSNFCEVLNLDLAAGADSAAFEVGSAEHRRW